MLVVLICRKHTVNYLNLIKLKQGVYYILQRAYNVDFKI